MDDRRTKLLVVLLVIAAIVCTMAWSRLDRAADGAERAAEDLAVCRGYLKELAQGNATTMPAGSVDASALNLRLRGAAAKAEISDKLVSVEPASTQRLGNSDYNELPVYVRLEGVSMEQIVKFASQLKKSDSACRARSIELEAIGTDQSPELWTADVTLGYLIYSPRQSG